MARVARRDGFGVCHHVLLRGLERRALFRDDRDRRDFLSRLRRQLDEGRGRCLAFALMTNHVHLVLRTGERPLSNVMRRLVGGYARSFNLRHDRVGYLFQGRFHSIVVADDTYLRVLVRYVHGNPLRAGLVDSLEALASYPWAGHVELVGSGGAGLLARDEVLALFGAGRAGALHALKLWMRAAPRGAEGREDGLLPDEARTPGPPAARNEGTALRWEPSGVRQPTPREIRALRLARAGWTLEAVVDSVCARLGADVTALRAGRRTRRESHARALIAALATCELALPLDRVAGATGVTAGPICRAIERGVRLARELRLSLDAGGPLALARQEGNSVPAVTSLAASPRARAGARGRRGAGGRARRA